MNERLYEYAVLLHPTEAERKDGDRSRLVVDVTRVLAENEQEVTMLAAKAVPDDLMQAKSIGRLEVAVRPF